MDVKNANGKYVTAVGLMAGYGSPNYALLREWRELWAVKDLNAAPKDLLMNVITDGYFEAVRSGLDIDAPASAVPPGGTGGFAPPPTGGGGAAIPRLDDWPVVGKGTSRVFDAASPRRQNQGGFAPPMRDGMPPGGAAGSGIPLEPADRVAVRARMVSKAQVTSWALIHHLAKNKSVALYKFFSDLDKLPRDMRIDSKILSLTFAKAFDLMDPDGAAIDNRRWEKFAEEWVASINAAPPTWVDREVKASE